MDKKVLRDFSYGMYIVSSSFNDIYNAQIANSIIQVSSEPVIFSVCLNRDNMTHDIIMKSGKLGISILSENTPLEFIGWFGFRSGNKIKKFDNLEFKFNYSIIEKVPIVLDNSVSYLLFNVISHHDIGTHTLFFCKCVDTKKLSSDKVMTYEYYHNVKKGMTQKRAPTYVENE